MLHFALQLYQTSLKKSHEYNDDQSIYFYIESHTRIVLFILPEGELYM